MNLGERFAARLRTERTARQLSQRDLAALVGWQQSTLSKLELGTRPVTLDDVEVLAHALGLTPLDLLDSRRAGVTLGRSYRAGAAAELERLTYELEQTLTRLEQRRLEIAADGHTQPRRGT